MVTASATPSFARYLGIDYSGAGTATSSLPGLRAYQSSPDSSPTEVLPPPSPRKYWTRRGLIHWLADLLAEDIPTLVGLDHGFSVPLRYFEAHHLELHWPTFLDDFHAHWPTDADHTSVQMIRDGLCGEGAARTGDARWRRLAEQRAGAKSVFHFDVPGSVAKSTHAGLPWLRLLRRRGGDRVHCWPFDGWAIPAGRSALAEAYPSLWSRSWPRDGRTPDQHDAYTIAAWLRQADGDGSLAGFLAPPLTPTEATIAAVEGWILGVR